MERLRSNSNCAIFRHYSGISRSRKNIYADGESKVDSWWGEFMVEGGNSDGEDLRTWRDGTDRGAGGNDLRQKVGTRFALAICWREEKAVMWLINEKAWGPSRPCGHRSRIWLCQLKRFPQRWWPDSEQCGRKMPSGPQPWSINPKPKLTDRGLKFSWLGREWPGVISTLIKNEL